MNTATFLRSLTLAAFACLTLSQTATAQSNIFSAALRDGWQLQNGNHMAAFHVTLRDGWKTYWRAPGDSGIPPSFDWSGSQNVKSVRFHWPRPEVLVVGGLQTIGYSQELVLPVEITPITPGQPIALKVAVDLGVCSDICVPASFEVAAELPRPGQQDATIVRALRQRPSTPKEAGLRSATCALSPSADGMRLRAEINMPSTGGQEVVVVEPGMPGIWVSSANVQRSGQGLTAEVDLVKGSGGGFGLQRDRIVLTVLGKNRAVEITGCDAP